jgi:hypothetical protein
MGWVDRGTIIRERFIRPFFHRCYAYCTGTKVNRKFWPTFVARKYFPGDWYTTLLQISTKPLAEITDASQMLQMKKEHRITHWIDRALFHHFDVIGGRLITILVRLHSLVALLIARESHLKEHFYERFVVTNSEFDAAWFYGLTTLLFQVSTLAYISAYRLPLLKLKPEEMKGFKIVDAPIYLSSIICWIFVDHIMIIVPCLAASSVFFVTGMFKHFGADYSFNFDLVYDDSLP